MWNLLRIWKACVTNFGRCTCEIKSRIAMANAAFSKKGALFTNTLTSN